jgi:hypothetical protein
MRFVILAHVDDTTALRVGAALRTRHGAGQVRLVAAEELVFAPCWAHWLDDTVVTTQLRLSDSTVLDSERLGVVFNRLRYVHLPHFGGATQADRSYAVAETFAFWMSWLASLPCPVLNPATPRGLGLQERSHMEWLKLAAQAGLPARGYRFISDPRRFPDSRYWPHERLPTAAPDGTNVYERVAPFPPLRRPTFFLEPVGEERRHALVTGDAVLDAPGEAYSASLRQLASLAGCDILQVTFARSLSGDDWLVCDITSFPHTHNPASIQAIVELLEAKLVTMEV